MDKPGKRAPTVEICKSDRPYEPLAMRQHATGPYPLDPNLISQGIPPDARVTPNDNIYGPLERTPRPPGPVPAAPAPTQAAVAPASGQLPPAPEGVAPPADPTGPLPGPAPDGGAVPAAPSAYGGTAPGKPGVAVAYYDPQNGRYLTPDGQYQQQASVVAPGAAKTWKDLLPT